MEDLPGERGLESPLPAWCWGSRCPIGCVDWPIVPRFEASLSLSLWALNSRHTRRRVMPTRSVHRLGGNRNRDCSREHGSNPGFDDHHHRPAAGASQGDQALAVGMLDKPKLRARRKPLGSTFHKISMTGYCRMPMTGARLREGFSTTSLGFKKARTRSSAGESHPTDTIDSVLWYGD